MAYPLPSDPTCDLDALDLGTLTDLHTRLRRFLTGVGPCDVSQETLTLCLADLVAFEVAERRRGITRLGLVAA